MFVLKEVDTFDWNVKAKVPGEKGKHQTITFMATFNILDQDTHDELISDPETRDFAKFLERALVCFRGIDVCDESGNMLDESDDENRNRIIRKSPLFIEPLINAYGAGIFNYKPKN